MMLTFGNRSLSRNPVFLFNSLTSESMGSKFSDMFTLLSFNHSIRERKKGEIYRFVRRKNKIKMTPIYGGVIYMHPYL